MNAVTFLYVPITFRIHSSMCLLVLSGSHTFLYVPRDPLAQTVNSITFLYVPITFRIRSSMFFISFVGKLYIPIRSVQPSRSNCELCYVPIRSDYVLLTFLNVFY